MGRTLGVFLLTLGLLLSWSMIHSPGLAQNRAVVIPMPVKVEVAKKNYAPVEKSGQKDCYRDDGRSGTCECGSTNCPSGQDGDLEKGVAWPIPRFTDNNDGTVTDNLTGLIWMKNAKCGQFFYYDYSWKNPRT